MQTGNWLTRALAAFRLPPPRAKAPEDEDDEEAPAGAAPPMPPGSGKPPAGAPAASPTGQPDQPAVAIKPDGADVAALRKAEEAKSLLPSSAYQLSPYAAAMMGYAGVKYNPDDLLSRKGFDIYKRMMLDEQIKAVVRFKISALLSRGYFLEYPKECELPEEVRKARIEVMNEGLRVMGGSFKTGLKTILTSVWQGFSITEKEHRRFTHKGETWIGLKALMARPFDTFYFEVDDHGHIEKIVQRIPGKKDVDVAANRVVYMVHNADMDPHYGQSDLREAYRPYFSKDMTIRFRNIYLERMAGGFVSLEQDQYANILPNSPEHAAIQMLLKNLSASTGVLLPRGVKATVHHPENTDAFERSITADNLAIAKSLLVPNLLGITEAGQTGAFAQSQTQFEAFLWTLDELGESVEEIVTEQILDELARANFADGIGPRFRLKPLSRAQQEALLKLWGEMLKAGAVKASDTDDRHVREMMDFPAEGAPTAAPPAVPQIDPETGEPLPPDQELGPDGKPRPKPAPRPGFPPRPGTPPVPPGNGRQPPAVPMEETHRGRKVRPYARAAHAHGASRAAMTSGERRFQFELAKARTENIEAASRRALHSAIKVGVGEMVGSLRKIGTDALQIGALEFSRPATAAVKRALKDGMVEAAELGIRLASGEVRAARGFSRGGRAGRGDVVVHAERVVHKAPAAPPRLKAIIKTVMERDGDSFASKIREEMEYEQEPKEQP